MNSTSYCLLLIVASLFGMLLVYTGIDQLKNRKDKKSALLSNLRATAINSQHPVAQQLLKLVETDGAGSWPPKASHYHSWPAALRPYHEIYLELAPLLAVTEASLDNEVNLKRLQRFRSLMRKALKDRVNLFDVTTVMAAAEAGTPGAMPRDAYNGFYGCVAMLRHAYRWATVPVVKVAQNEKLVTFPVELDAPWKFFQSHFGIHSPGGNVTSNYFCNFDAEGRMQYKINIGMSDTIKNAEYHFGHMFVELETLALPIYCEMYQSIIDFESGDYESCLKHVKSINSQLRIPLKAFYERMHESKIARSVWMAYVQGFQGWATGEMIDGEYVEFDGLSGNQSMFFRIVDAFLGLDSYLTEEEIERYVPIGQQKVFLSYKEHSFREKAKGKGLSEIEVEMHNLVKQFKVFRTAHVKRVMPYLKVPAPERFAMTAGKSLSAHSDLNRILIRRLQETV